MISMLTVINDSSSSSRTSIGIISSMIILPASADNKQCSLCP